ncbi:MAG TPA: ester cyclase [Gammaproteobacteria bacterium]|nr:ester cyclase [Gammaproteobacteria bacterium]
MEANKRVVEKYVSCFNVGDLAGLSEVFSADALIYGVLGWGKVGDVMPIWKQLVDGLAMRLEIEDIIAQGDVVAVRYKETGRAKAPFFDKPATGKTYELVAMEWFVIRDGKIERRWGARDAASQAQQLGWTAPATKSDVEASR